MLTVKNSRKRRSASGPPAATKAGAASPTRARSVTAPPHVRLVDQLPQPPELALVARDAALPEAHRAGSDEMLPQIVVLEARQASPYGREGALALLEVGVGEQLSDRGLRGELQLQLGAQPFSLQPGGEQAGQ